MSIDWQEDLSTGIESIDSQHKEIFARFAVFSDACADETAGVELLRLLDFLSEYTLKHFQDEEKAMADAEYPRLGEQEKAHTDFVSELGRFKTLVEINGPSMELVLNEKRAMIQWLIHHIRNMDRAFAEFLSSN